MVHACLTRYPVITVDGMSLVDSSFMNRRMVNGVIPRIFIARSDRSNILQDLEYNDMFYGRAVEFDELNEVLERSTAYWEA